MREGALRGLGVAVRPSDRGSWLSFFCFVFAGAPSHICGWRQPPHEPKHHLRLFAAHRVLIADTPFSPSSSVPFPHLWSMATACADPTYTPAHGSLSSDFSRHHVCPPRLVVHRGHQAALHSVTRIDLERGGTRHPPLLARSDPLLWPALLPRPGSRAALASVWGEHGRVGEVFEGDGTAAYSEMVEWRAGEGGKEREGKGGGGAGLGRLPQLRCCASLP